MRFDATADRDITGLGTWGELAYSLEDPRHVLEGFHGQLSEPQEGALRELYGLVESLNLDLTLVRGQPAEPLRLCLLRFLRANGFNAPKALAQLEENVNFRDRENVVDLLQQKASDVLGCDPEAINRYFPHWDFGEDRVGRPVLCKQYGGFVVSELLSLTTMESMVRSHVWEQEMTLRLMRRRSLARGAIVDSVVVIIDTGGMAMRQVTADFIALMKRVAHVDQAMYPELLGQMFIINTPGLFTYVWKMFAPLLDSRTRDKIKIFSRPRDWQPALLELIPADVLPPEYGGTGVPL
ncbi:CRAL-TRIO domain-containing protein, partial [Tribonema minus]